MHERRSDTEETFGRARPEHDRHAPAHLGGDGSGTRSTAARDRDRGVAVVCRSPRATGLVCDRVMQVAFPSALVNAFVVEADVPTLVDTGTPGSAAKLISALRGRSHVGRLRRIILTHRHADHAGNAAELARVSGAEVFASPDDAPYVSRGIDQPRPRAATRLGQFMVPYVKLALPWAVERVDVDDDLIDGTQIGPFRVIATPGHTAGHVSLLWEERGILFTGDAAANVTRVGPHPAADDPATARESFRRLGTLDFDVACFGHGRPVVGDAARQFRAAT